MIIGYVRTRRGEKRKLGLDNPQVREIEKYSKSCFGFKVDAYFFDESEGIDVFPFGKLDYILKMMVTNDILICYDPTRLTRSIKRLEYIRKSCEERGLGLIIISEHNNLSTTAPETGIGA